MHRWVQSVSNNGEIKSQNNSTNKHIILQFKKTVLKKKKVIMQGI
jgi:hypothetical protein